MRDIWAFLLQTLTASGVALLILVIKAIFGDKLTPRWQFAVWGVLGIFLLIPAGAFGRYTLVNWPLLVEAVKTMASGDYGLTTIVAPVPLLPGGPPETLWDWLFLAYFAGVILCALRYLTGYVRLRRILKHGNPVTTPMENKMQKIQELYSLNTCQVIGVPGLKTAFVCGLFHPILALPEGEDTDEKVILHELLHLKHHDVIRAVVICLFRCIHWCNPFLWYCADRAGNDLESLCDQRVLERLEGEDRRDYGRILLSMANDRYARAPGTSSIANGGRNIRRRIEAIARFKRYPKGMVLASFAVLLVLTATLAVGAYSGGQLLTGNMALNMASARLNFCTSPGAAVDTYAKAVLTGSVAYRAACAPLEEQEALVREMAPAPAGLDLPNFWNWDSGNTEPLDRSKGYTGFGFEADGTDAYRTMLAFPTTRVFQRGNESWMKVVTRDLRVYREGQRWVAEPEGSFVLRETPEMNLTWGTSSLPAKAYTAETEDFRLTVFFQKTLAVDNEPEPPRNGVLPDLFGTPEPSFSTQLKTKSNFDEVRYSYWMTLTYTGDPGRKDRIREVGLSVKKWDMKGERPRLSYYSGIDDINGTDGRGSWARRQLEENWDDVIELGGGGSSAPFEEWDLVTPACYIADLYINEEKAAELTLLPEEGRT